MPWFFYSFIKLCLHNSCHNVNPPMLKITMIHTHCHLCQVLFHAPTDERPLGWVAPPQPLLPWKEGAAAHMSYQGFASKGEVPIQEDTIFLHVIVLGWLRLQNVHACSWLLLGNKTLFTWYSSFRTIHQCTEWRAEKQLQAFRLENGYCKQSVWIIAKIPSYHLNHKSSINGPSAIMCHSYVEEPEGILHMWKPRLMSPVLILGVSL